MKIEEFYEKLAENEEELYYPIFDSKDVIIDKVETGYKITLLDYTQIDLNEVAYTILQLCSGNTSIKQIVFEIVNIYDASEEIIHKDVLRILYDFWTNGIIKWKDKRNFFSVLYEQQMEDGYTFKVPVLKESLVTVEKHKEEIVFDSRYSAEVKFTAAYIEKGARTNGMRFFECWHKEELILMFSCTPEKSYIESEEIISFNLDAVYINAKKANEVKNICQSFMKWSLSWFDGLDLESKNFLHIQIAEQTKSTLLEAILFYRVSAKNSNEIYYEKCLE